MSALLKTRNRLRQNMPVTRKWAYFDHAAVAPLSAPAEASITSWAKEAACHGDVNWLSWERTVEATRSAAAKLIQASPDEIALMPSTTAGINLVAEGIYWQQGDNVVILADEYPSNVYPWLNLKDRGVETRLVSTNNGKVDLDRLREACDEMTRLVSLSWVGFTTGYRQDINRIADIVHSAGGKHSSRAFFLVDAIQGLGAIPLNVKETPIDFLAADGHKWMLGPEGAAMAYIRLENLEELRPHGVGWHSVVNNHDFSNIDMNFLPTAARFEGGSANMPGMHAFGSSLDLLQSFDTGTITESILDITDYLCEKLSEIDYRVVSHREVETNGHDPRSGIVSTEPVGITSEQARVKLLDAGVVTRCRAGWLRFSPHAYNTYDEIDQAIDVLKP